MKFFRNRKSPKAESYWTFLSGGGEQPVNRFIKKIVYWGYCLKESITKDFVIVQ